MHLTIVGLGLIGGSVARSLRGSTPGGGDWAIDGWSPSEATRRAAFESGAIDRIVSLERAVAAPGLVLLAAPPLACLDLLEEIGGRLHDRLNPEMTLTDVASTKAAMIARAERYGLPFVGGHPMAGRETTGFGVSSPDLFADRPWVLVRASSARDIDVERVRALAIACGAHPLAMEAAAHDEAVAAISHLPLVLSAALVEAVCGRPGEPAPAGWPAAAGLAAGGWRDMTRLARGDPAMGAGIATTNAGPLADRLRAIREILDQWIAALAEGPDGVDAGALERRFAGAAARVAEPPLATGEAT